MKGTPIVPFLIPHASDDVLDVYGSEPVNLSQPRQNNIPRQAVLEAIQAAEPPTKSVYTEIDGELYHVADISKPVEPCEVCNGDFLTACGWCRDCGYTPEAEV